MKEADRKARNTERLTECHPPFAKVVRKVIDQLEAEGFRPRIQHAWRSKAEQLELFNAGTTKTKFGFHNMSSPSGAKDSLACDLLDDDHPLDPGPRYLLSLARAARKAGVGTGILWGLPQPLVNGVEAALAAGNMGAEVKVGWDPTHVEPVTISLADARKGLRPTFSGTTGGGGGGTGGGKKTYVVKSGDTLGRIANANGITLARLLKLNPKFVPNPNLIRVGDVVKLA